MVQFIIDLGLNEKRVLQAKTYNTLFCLGSKLAERCVENTEIFLTRWEDFRGGFESLTQEEKDLPKDDSRSAYFFSETESEVLAVCGFSAAAGT